MNLIEQLGGYERTKNHRDYLIDFGNEFNRPNKYEVNKINNALLEYRRAHNIFEMGDYIIHDGELKVFAMWSNAIDGCAYIGYAYAEDGEMAHKDEFRHATDEEIKAGKRLEVSS